MKNLLNKVWKKEEGFTLIELIIVIAILAIIAAIAIPNVLSAVDNSRRTTDISNGKMIADAIATVKAKDDGFSGESGFLTMEQAPGHTPTTFEAAIAEQLNSVPTPKYKGVTGSDIFVVYISTTDSSIKVYAAATGASAVTANEVFPEPTSDYDNK